MTVVEGFDVTKLNDVSALADEFHERIGRMVYCTTASIDTQDRPRLRILHPIWEGLTGWFFTYPDSPKMKHIARNPHFAVAYTGDVVKPVYIDCVAENIEALAEKERLWELYCITPPPMGSDPSLGFPGKTAADLALIRLTPWRVEIYTLGVGTKIWQTR